ncbi:hypothetical protein HAX54_039664 [Datura stramonium]|uniref:Uncharacterized protein n=1 Tax=Datura stramonium TaxID=4076 RepID=A0ABS8SJF6_DATST|nr:hypothetical protein [Datura stramonium]
MAIGQIGDPNPKTLHEEAMEFTGPQTSPELFIFWYPRQRSTDSSSGHRPSSAIVPTSNPETVFDIKYYSRDQRRNRPPIRRTFLNKADVEKMRMEYKFDVNDFPKPYLTAKVVEDENAIGGGYQK